MKLLKEINGMARFPSFWIGIMLIVISLLRLFGVS